MIKRLISGFQNGVDISAIFVAYRFGVEVGGTMPKGFKTLDGPRPEYAITYNAKEHKSVSYSPRTYCNVKDADGTLRIFTHKNSAGEICTLKAINYYNKPYIDVDLNDPIKTDKVINWITTNNIKILNVAGNSEKTSKGITLLSGKYLYNLFLAMGFSLKKVDLK
jgi:hypothetical protein